MRHVMQHNLRGWAAAIGILIAASSASAHPPPYGRGVRALGEGDGRALAVLTNRGVMLSSDNGASWGFTCYEAIGYTASQRPPFALTQDGHLLLATFMGPVRSDATWCNYAVVDGPLADLALPTMAQSPQDAAAFHVTTGVGGTDNGHYRSDDHGQSWTLVGESSSEVILERLRIADADPQRVYASGLDTQFNYFIARSDDGGQTWVRNPFPLTDGELSVYLLAIDPTDADTLFAHVQSRDGTIMADRLVRSTDAGASWETILDIDGLEDFVFAPDGSAAWVGGVDALLRSDDGGATFATVGELTGITCLSHIDGELWICGQYSASGVGVVTSTDGGESFEHVLAFDEVDRMLACDANSDVAQQCAVGFAEWEREVLGIDAEGDGGAPQVIDTRVIDTAAGDGGTGDAGAGGDPTQDGGDGGGCGCRVGADNSRGDSTALLAALATFALGLALRMRRRRVL